jgi:hypothetical protein
MDFKHLDNQIGILALGKGGSVATQQKANGAYDKLAFKTDGLVISGVNAGISEWGREFVAGLADRNFSSRAAAKDTGFTRT